MAVNLHRRKFGRVGAGDAVELFGEDVAHGGLFLLGSVLEYGHVMAQEADAELAGPFLRCPNSSQQPRDGKVLVHIRPIYVLAFPDKTKVSALLGSAVH
ncbi:MAG TPA: hypothetical protein VJ840_12250 [Gemmatimonadaceae bacterium]|nr:hypothetical protein [Gemmatimonadaceae bacterium]